VPLNEIYNLDAKGCYCLRVYRTVVSTFMWISSTECK